MSKIKRHEAKGWGSRKVKVRQWKIMIRLRWRKPGYKTTATQWAFSSSVPLYRFSAVRPVTVVEPSLLLACKTWSIHGGGCEEYGYHVVWRRALLFTYADVSYEPTASMFRIPSSLNIEVHQKKSVNLCNPTRCYNTENWNLLYLVLMYLTGLHSQYRKGDSRKYFNASMWRSSMALPTYSRQILPAPALGCYQSLPFRWPCIVINSYYSLRAGSGSWSCSQAVSKPVWHLPLLRVQWKTPGDGQRNCQKHVDFYSKK